MQCQRVAAGIVFAAGLGLAQVEPSPLEGAFRIFADVERVVLPVTVVDRQDRIVPNLTRDCFRIYDDGRLQAVHDFFYRDIPLTVGLVMDSSTSMMPKRTSAVLAAQSFVRLSNPEDQAFVVNFNERVSFGLSETFSADPERLGNAFLKLPCQGKTALYDAVVAATEHLSGGTRDKKALIVVSDGGDNASRHRLRETMEALQRSEAIVYTIGLYDADDPDRNPGVLKQLARPTGGEAFFPQKSARSARHPGACCQGPAQPVHHHLRACRRGPRWPLSPYPRDRDGTRQRPPAGGADAGRLPSSRPGAHLHGGEPVKAPLRAVEMLLWAAAALLLGVYAFVYPERNVYQAFQMWSFDRTLQRMPAPRAVPAALPPGAPIGRIEIPRIGVRAMIVNGTTSTTLRRAVGHIEGTPLFASGGNVGQAAHRDTFFRRLRDIRRGDTIEIDTLQGAYEYVVDATRIVGPDDTTVLDASGRTHAHAGHLLPVRLCRARAAAIYRPGIPGRRSFRPRPPRGS